MLNRLSFPQSFSQKADSPLLAAEEDLCASAQRGEGDVQSVRFTSWTYSHTKED